MDVRSQRPGSDKRHLPGRPEYKIMEEFKSCLAKRPWEYLDQGNYEKYLKVSEDKRDPSVHRKELLQVYADILALIKVRQNHVNSQFVNPKFDLVKHDFKCICRNTLKFQHTTMSFESERPPKVQKTVEKAKPKTEPVVEEEVKEMDLNVLADVGGEERPQLVSSRLESESNRELSEPDPAIDRYFSSKYFKTTETKLKKKDTKKVTIAEPEEGSRLVKVDEADRDDYRKMDSLRTIASSELMEEPSDKPKPTSPIQHKNTYLTEELMVLPSIDLESLHRDKDPFKTEKKADKPKRGAPTPVAKKVSGPTKKVEYEGDTKVSHQEQEMRNDLMHLLETVPVFSDLPKARLLEISKHFRLKSYFANASIILAGEAPQEFYIVASGTVSSYDYDPETLTTDYRRTYLCSDYFGETLIIKGGVSEQFYIADSHVTLQAMSASVFKTVLGDLFESFDHKMKGLTSYATYRFDAMAAPSRFFTKIELDKFASGEELLRAVKVLSPEQLLGFLEGYEFLTNSKNFEKVAKKLSYHEYLAKEILVGVGKNENLFLVYEGIVSLQVYEEDLNRQLELVSFGPGSYLGKFKFKSEVVTGILEKSSFVAKEKLVLLCLEQKYVQKYLAGEVDQIVNYLENLYKSNYLAFENNKFRLAHMDQSSSSAKSPSSELQSSPKVSSVKSPTSELQSSPKASSPKSEASRDSFDRASLKSSDQPSLKSSSPVVAPSAVSSKTGESEEPSLASSESSPVLSSSSEYKSSGRDLSSGRSKGDDDGSGYNRELSSSRSREDTGRDSFSSRKSSARTTEKATPRSQKNEEQEQEQMVPFGSEFPERIVSRKSFDAPADVSIRSSARSPPETARIVSRKSFDAPADTSIRSSIQSLPETSRIASRRSFDDPENTSIKISARSVLETSRIVSRKSFDQPEDVSIRSSIHSPPETARIVSRKSFDAPADTSIRSSIYGLPESARIASRRSFDNPEDVSIRSSVYPLLDTSRIVSRRSFDQPADVSIRSSLQNPLESSRTVSSVLSSSLQESFVSEREQEEQESARLDKVEEEAKEEEPVSSEENLFTSSLVKVKEAFKTAGLVRASSDSQKSSTTEKQSVSSETEGNLVDKFMDKIEDYKMFFKSDSTKQEEELAGKEVEAKPPEKESSSLESSRTDESELAESGRMHKRTSEEEDRSGTLESRLSPSEVELSSRSQRSVSEYVSTESLKSSVKELLKESSSLLGRESKDSEVSSVASDVKFIFNLSGSKTKELNGSYESSSRTDESVGLLRHDSSRVEDNDNFVNIHTLSSYGTNVHKQMTNVSVGNLFNEKTSEDESLTSEIERKLTELLEDKTSSEVEERQDTLPPLDLLKSKQTLELMFEEAKVESVKESSQREELLLGQLEPTEQVSVEESQPEDEVHVSEREQLEYNQRMLQLLEEEQAKQTSEEESVEVVEQPTESESDKQPTDKEWQPEIEPEQPLETQKTEDDRLFGVMADSLERVVERQVSNESLLRSSRTVSIDSIITKNYPNVEESINSVLDVIRTRSIETSRSGTSMLVTERGPVGPPPPLEVELVQPQPDQPPKEADKSPSLDFAEIPNLTKIISRVHDIYMSPHVGTQSVTGSKFSSIDEVYVELDKIERLYHSKSFTSQPAQETKPTEPQEEFEPILDVEPTEPAETKQEFEHKESLFDLNKLYAQSSTLSNESVGLLANIYDTEHDEVLEGDKEKEEFVLSLDSVTDKLKKELSIDSLGKQLSIGSLSKQLSMEGLSKQLSMDNLTKQLSVENLGKQLSIDNLSKTLSVNNLTKQLSVENLTKDLSLDTITKDLNLEGITKDLSFDSISKDLGLDTIAKELSNIGSSISSQISGAFSSKVSEADENAPEEPVAEGERMSFVEGSKLVISSIFDNVLLGSKEQESEQHPEVQPEVEAPEEKATESEKEPTVVEDETSEKSEEEQLMEDKVQLLARISLDSSVSSFKSSPRVITTDRSLRSSTGRESDKFSLASSVKHTDTESLTSERESDKFSLGSSVKQLYKDTSTEKDSDREADGVSLASSVKQTYKETSSEKESYQPSLRSSTERESDRDTFSTDRGSPLTTERSLSSSGDVPHRPKSTTTEKETDGPSLAESVDNSFLSTDSESSLTSDSFSSGNENTESEGNLEGSEGIVEALKSSDQASNSCAGISSSSLESGGEDSQSLLSSLTGESRESFESRRTSSIDSNDDDASSALSNAARTESADSFAGGTNSVDSNMDSNDQIDNLERVHTYSDEEKEEYEEFDEMEDTADSYEEEYDYDEETILSIKNLLMSTLKNKYKSVGASYVAMDLERTGKVTLEVFLNFIEKLGIGAIDHNEQNLMFELLKEDNKDYISFASFFKCSGQAVETLADLNQHLISIFGSSRIAFERFFATLKKSTRCCEVDFVLMMNQVGLSEECAKKLFEKLDVCKTDSVTVFTMLKMIVGDWDEKAAVEYEEKINTNLNRLVSYLTPESLEEFNNEFTRTLSIQFFDQHVEGSLVTDLYEEFYIDHDLRYFDELSSLLSEQREFSSLSVAQKRFVVSLFNVVDTRDNEDGFLKYLPMIDEQEVMLIPSNEIEPALVALINGSMEMSFDGITYPKSTTVNSPCLPNYSQFIASIERYTTEAFSHGYQDDSERVTCGYSLTFKLGTQGTVFAVMPMPVYMYNVLPLINERHRRLPVMLQFLKSVPSFSVFTPEELDRIVCACTVRQFKLHESVVRTGDPPTHFYLIFDGTLTVTNEYNFEFKTLGRTDFFSCSDLVNNQVSSFTLIANCSLVLLSWERNEFFRVFPKFSTLLENDACNINDFQNLSLQKYVNKRVSFADSQ